MERGLYTSQGERPLVDFVRQLLNSCGMSCTVQSMAPVKGGWVNGGRDGGGYLTYGTEYVLGYGVHGHRCLLHGTEKIEALKRPETASETTFLFVYFISAESF